MKCRKTKIARLFISGAEKVRSVPTNNIADPVKRDHKAGRISLMAAILYWLGGDKEQAKNQIEMWRYLRKVKK